MRGAAPPPSIRVRVCPLCPLSLRTPQSTAAPTPSRVDRRGPGRGDGPAPVQHRTNTPPRPQRTRRWCAQCPPPPDRRDPGREDPLVEEVPCAPSTARTPRPWSAQCAYTHRREGGRGDKETPRRGRRWNACRVGADSSPLFRTLCLWGEWRGWGRGGGEGERVGEVGGTAGDTPPNLKAGDEVGFPPQRNEDTFDPTIDRRHRRSPLAREVSSKPDLTTRARMRECKKPRRSGDVLISPFAIHVHNRAPCFSAARGIDTPARLRRPTPTLL
jgi:hypothetical protein